MRSYDQILESGPANLQITFDDNEQGRARFHLSIGEEFLFQLSAPYAWIRSGKLQVSPGGAKVEGVRSFLRIGTTLLTGETFDVELSQGRVQATSLSGDFEFSGDVEVSCGIPARSAPAATTEDSRDCEDPSNVGLTTRCVSVTQQVAIPEQDENSTVRLGYADRNFESELCAGVLADGFLPAPTSN